MAAPLEPFLVQGALPAGLSGRLLGIGPASNGDGVVHSVELRADRGISYRQRRVVTDGPDIVARHIVVFGGSILALGEGSLAYELTAELDTLRRVDLAGQSRGLAACSTFDAETRDLHLLTVPANGSQAHVVVSAGALTRTSRTIASPPQPITDLAITRDRAVFVADGFVGAAPRGGEAHVAWVTTGTIASALVHAHDVGDSVVVIAFTPSLERWTLHPASATLRRELLDPTPWRFAHAGDHSTDLEPRFVWSTGRGAAVKHDLLTPSRVRHNFGLGQPDDLVFVRDTTRPSDADGGWLVGFVHQPSIGATDLVVLDAADLAGPALATVRIPRPVPRGLRATWVASIPE